MATKKKKTEKSNEQAMSASSVPGEYITYTETRPGHLVANVLTREEVQSSPESAMQAPEEDREALRNAPGHNSLADRETPREGPEPDFETEYGHLTTQVPQLLKAILRELYLIRRAK